MRSSKITTHIEGIKRMVSQKAFEDYLERTEEVISMRSEVADKFRDLNPPETEILFPEGWTIHPWVANWIRERGRLDQKTCDKLNYEEHVEWIYRVLETIEVCRRVESERPSPEELIETKWLCYLSKPPAYLVRSDIGFQSTVALYGEHATTICCHVNLWKAEFTWVHGFHNEKGVPVQYWVVGVSEEIDQYHDQEDREKILTPTEFNVVPKDVSFLLNRRDFRTGFKLREIPKQSPYDLQEWLRPVRDTVMDLRDEIFPRWATATLYLSVSPGIFGVSAQQTLWCTEFLGDFWMAMNAKMLGIPMEAYTSLPAPEALNAVMGLPREAFSRTLLEMFLSGPKGLQCDAVNKKTTSETKTPLIHDMRLLMFERDGMFKDFAIPYDRGIPPPMAFLTGMGCPIYKEMDLKNWVVNPDKIHKEFRELLESEGGIDFETGRVPPYSEVPRLKWLFDPTIEWLRPKDFPPLDWSMGQVWPIDITREKMQIMVEEGYDGSGKDILHYSSLADKKLGQLGKTITLGTMPYKLPVCGCSPQCG